MSRILIVEDDEAIREMLRMCLELEGYEVSVAANGREALALLEAEDVPCTVLLDLMMPIMNGIEFLQLRRNNPRLSAIPVIIVSAYGNMVREVQASDLQTQGILMKPIDLAVLLELVRQQNT